MLRVSFPLCILLLLTVCVHAEPKHSHLMVKSIKCNEKTEPTDDETMFLVIQKDSKNEVVEYVRETSMDMGSGETEKDIFLQDLEGMIWVGDGHATDFLIIAIEVDHKGNDAFIQPLRDFMKNRTFPNRAATTSSSGADDSDEIVRCLPFCGQSNSLNSRGGGGQSHATQEARCADPESPYLY